MRSQNCSVPAHQRFQVFRPLISSAESLMPPSIGWKTSTASSGKSSGLRPPASSTSETLLGTPPDARHTMTAAEAKLNCTDWVRFFFIIGQAEEKFVLRLIRSGAENLSRDKAFPKA